MHGKIWFVLILAAAAPAAVADFLDRFKPHGRFDNYAVFQDTDGDDASLQARYSFKYNFFDCEVGYRADEERLTTCGDSARAKFYGYFSYTGEFDFYMGTRDSSPVINRSSNPAIHGLWEFTDDSGLFDWIDVGIEHRSNGQVIDADERDDRPGSPTAGQFLTEIEFQDGNREYFDAISRSANYLSFTIGRHPGRSFGWHLGYKYYVSDESDITWGELAGKDVSIEDYDILRLGYSDTFGLGNTRAGFNEITVVAEYVLGRELGDTDSLDLAIVFPYETDDGWDIPWTLRIHSGPMERLSNYTESIDSVGLGVTFSY